MAVFTWGSAEHTVGRGPFAVTWISDGGGEPAGEWHGKSTQSTAWMYVEMYKASLHLEIGIKCDKAVIGSFEI